MYRFVRLKDTHYNIEYGWRLACSDIQTVVEHTDKYGDAMIIRGVEDVLNSGIKGHHLTTAHGSAISDLSKIRGESVLVSAYRLCVQGFAGKAKQISLGRTLYLNDNGSYFLHTDSHVILETMMMEKMVYPTYSKEDIVVSRWPGGTHWYARIGRMDVITPAGLRKWNTKRAARRAAESFLIKINHDQNFGHHKSNDGSN